MNPAHRMVGWLPAVHGDLTWPAAATLIAAALTVVGVVLSLLASSAAHRRQRRAQIFADAVRAVSDYLEGPYRIARCHNLPDQRFALVSEMSDVQGRIDAHVLLIQLHAGPKVSAAYDRYVAAAKAEAGTQMQEQWRLHPAAGHTDMNMSDRSTSQLAPTQAKPLTFDRTRSNAAKRVLVREMRKDVRPGGRPWRWFT